MLVLHTNLIREGVTRMAISISDKLSHSRALLADRNFFLLLCGQVVSQIGENLNRVALFWFVYIFTHRVGDMVIVGVLQTLPPLLFGWLNGVLLDRYSKKWIMIGVDVTRGVMVLFIPLFYWLHLLTLPFLYILIFLIATMSGVFGPALYSAIPLIVGREKLLSANALMQTTGQIGLLVGPVLGGILAVLWSPSGEMLINGVTFIASAIFLVFIAFKEVASAGHGGQQQGILEEVREGVGFVFSPHRNLLAPFLFMALYGFVTGPVNILLLLLSNHVLNRGAEGFGDLVSAFGVGMLLSSLLLTFYHPRNSVSFIVGGFSFAGILSLGIATITAFPVELFLFALWGAAVSVINPLSQTLIQHMTPPRLLARVLTVMSMGFLVGLIAGITLFPELSTRYGILHVFEFMGIILLLPVLKEIPSKVRRVGDTLMGRSLPDVDI